MITRKLTPKGWEIYDTEDVKHDNRADNSGPSAEPAISSPSNATGFTLDNPGSGNAASPSAGADAGGDSSNTVAAGSAREPGKRGKSGRGRNPR